MNLKYNIQIMLKSMSPLRYPGGKSRAVKHLLPGFAGVKGDIVSPFLGGGHLETALCSAGFRVFGSDIYAPLVCFWRELLSNPQGLAKEISRHFPASVKSASSLVCDLDLGGMTSAVSFYVINRCSFSGLSESGGFSQESCDKRFTKSSIDRIGLFSCPNLSVDELHFRDALKLRPNTTAYLDPPYYKESLALYGKRGGSHRGFEHEELRDILVTRDSDWILSYDDHPEIEKMYEGFRMIRPSWSYGLGRALNRKSRELLIVSDGIKLDQALEF